MADSLNYFKPRSHSETLTNDFQEYPVPAKVRKILFITSDGNSLVRINNTGGNYFVVNENTSAFEIPIRDDMKIEMRGVNGGEKIFMYIS